MTQHDVSAAPTLLAVEVIATEELGDRSYVAHDGTTAVVIDPQRDIDRVEAVLADHALTCAIIVETHIHNDYVTGGYELARRTGARYVICSGDPVTFEHEPVEDGDVLHAGGLTVRVVATPGHTDTHLAYVISAGPSAIEDPAAPAPAVFTGGSLLFGSVGRTDLLAVERTEELTRAQFHSVRRLAAMLPDETPIYPTHGFGSFCSSGSATGGQASTLGEQRQVNDALLATDEDSFVEQLIANLTAYPAYYVHMAPRNRTGPQAPTLDAPTPVNADDLRERLRAGEWVVDLRQRAAFAAGHLRSSIGIELGPQFTTYLGWLFPWDTPLTVIGGDADDVAEVQRQLSRIGIDELAGAATGDPTAAADPGEVSSYPRVGFADLPAAIADRARAGVRQAHEHGHHHVAPALDGDLVLDVRRDDERAGGEIPGSVHVPLHRLLTALDALPSGRLWVHCVSGFRASIAASLLERAGRDVVLIDDPYAEAVRSGLAIG